MPPLPLQSTVVFVSAQSSFEEDGRLAMLFGKMPPRSNLQLRGFFWLALATVLAVL